MINHSIDYWSVVMSLCAEHKIDLEARLKRKIEVIAEVASTSNKSIDFSIRYIRPSEKPGEYIYLVSVWGFGTSQTVCSIPELMEVPTRIDLRAEFACDSDVFNQIRNLHTVQPASNVSFNSYNTRDRKKRDERDRGGRGFAYGSLKSRRRVSIYKPARSQFAAIEVQLRKEDAANAGAFFLEHMPDYYSTDGVTWVKAILQTEKETYQQFASFISELYTGETDRFWTEVGDRASDAYRELQDMYTSTLLTEVTNRKKTPRN